MDEIWSLTVSFNRYSMLHALVGRYLLFEYQISCVFK